MRERTVLLLMAIFIGMTLASTYMGWASEHTVLQVYSASARELASLGKDAPPAPAFPHLAILRNMIIYVVLIGALLAMVVGHAAGMRDRKAGVVRLLFSRPITKREYLLGKVLGVTAVLALTVLCAAAISTASAALLTPLSGTDALRILGFYGLALAYVVGFALLGLCVAYYVGNEAVALLIPVIVWLTITFVLPELTSALYPTGALNPVLPPTDAPGSPLLQAVREAVSPLSISEHFKALGAAALGILPQGAAPSALGGSRVVQAGAMVAWPLACLGACILALDRFEPAAGDIYE